MLLSKMKEVWSKDIYSFCFAGPVEVSRKRGVVEGYIHFCFAGPIEVSREKGHDRRIHIHTALQAQSKEAEKG